MIRIKNCRGDTIVEVLIAVAIVSLTLTGGFVSSNRSFQATRTAQEQGEALKIAESQVEQIKVAVDKGSPDVFTPGNFCLDAGVVTAGCNISPSGYPIRTVVNHVANSHDFDVQVTWDGLAGTVNRVELVYKAL